VINNNKKLFRFEQSFDDGKIAYLEYRWKMASMQLMRTYVPPEHRNKGIASALTVAAFQHARDNNLKVQIFCPFITLFMEKHREYADLLEQ
jgi:predicted GNAT family acetyltransferase